MEARILPQVGTLAASIVFSCEWKKKRKNTVCSTIAITIAIPYRHKYSLPMFLHALAPGYLPGIPSYLAHHIAGSPVPDCGIPLLRGSRDTQACGTTLCTSYRITCARKFLRLRSFPLRKHASCVQPLDPSPFRTSLFFLQPMVSFFRVSDDLIFVFSIHDGNTFHQLRLPFGHSAHV